MPHLSLTDEAAVKIRETITEAGGNEIFFMVFPGDDGALSEFRVLARGNAAAVPAILNILKPGDIVVHNHPSGNLTPSDADLEVASRLGNLGVGVYITDNNVGSFYAVVEPQQHVENTPLDFLELKDILSPRGPVADKLRDYEYREGQIRMMEAVVDGFNNDKIVTVEAGTGTGKTLAYLIPAIQWSLTNKERCLVSTNTINLQEQIIKKDIPFLGSVFRESFKAVLVKGRNNYLCLRRAEAESREMGISWSLDKKDGAVDGDVRGRSGGPVTPNDAAGQDDTEELSYIIRWAHSTADGSLTDLPIQPRRDTWERVQCEIDSCTRMKCGYYDACFLVKARREAAFANVLVVNHHLLCADLSLRFQMQSYADIAVLPPYHRVIIDEVHHFEMVATEYFGVSVSRGWLIRLLGRLYSEKRGRESQGILSRIRTKLILKNKGSAKAAVSPLISLIEKKIIPEKDELLEIGNAFFEKIQIFSSSGSSNENFERKLRITPRVTEREIWKQEIVPSVHEVIRHVQELIKHLENLIEGRESLPGSVQKELADDMITLTSQLARCNGMAEAFHRIFFEDDKERVTWIETQERLRGISIAVKAAPLNVSSEISDSLFRPFRTVVLTSATIAVKTDFTYLHHRLGVDEADRERLIDRVVESPFDYEKQVVVGIPVNLPDPGESSFQDKADAFIGRALVLSGGRAFVLFTSYKMMNNSFSALEESLEGAGINVLKQGTENRSRLLDTFRRDISSTLFGTDSFWEGVDVEGSALEMVIIVRLPFRVPTEPIIEARVEDIEKKGGNAFYEYTVPQAVIKFKQGFGRLIRRKTDKGIVIILDKRIKSKPYGRMFLDSLPKCGVVTGESESIFREIARIFGNDT